MKKLLLIACLFSCTMIFAQNPVNFKTTKHSFGKIAQHKPATYSFAFTNTSAKPVVVEIATAECGCTTPVYPKEPVPPGKSSEIKVTYNAEAMGTFTKKVNVKLANVDAPVVLVIDGEVIVKKQ